MSKKEDDIGYKKPPKATRFKPGHSGNAKGRPKGSRNMTSILEKELNKKVNITVNGRVRRMTKREIIAMQMVNQAAQGDTKTIPYVLGHTRLIEEREAGKQGQESSSTSEDLKTLKGALDRIRAFKEEDDADQD